MSSDLLHKAVALSGKVAPCTCAPILHACYCFLATPASPHAHVRYVHTLSVCTLKVHQLPSGHLNSRQNKLRSQWGVGGQPAPGHVICRGCLPACVCKYFYLSPERPPLERLLSSVLTLAALVCLRSEASSQPSSCLKNTPRLSSFCLR